MRARTINEISKFERGLDPKEAMGIGAYAKRVRATCPNCNNTYTYTGKDVLSMKHKNNLFSKKTYNYFVQCPFCSSGFLVDSDIKLYET